MHALASPTAGSTCRRYQPAVAKCAWSEKPPRRSLSQPSARGASPNQCAKRGDADRCLSVVVAAHDVDETGRTSLDVEAASRAERDALADALDALLAERANHVLKATRAPPPEPETRAAPHVRFADA